jgi:hypothetical protein
MRLATTLVASALLALGASPSAIADDRITNLPGW